LIASLISLISISGVALGVIALDCALSMMNGFETEFRQRIVETTGVFAYLASNLAENNVNVVETVSCYTDSIFIVNESDMIYGYSILTKVIESAEEVDSIEE
jgi:ABC-type lipoprotein release transport system permease subunit